MMYLPVVSASTLNNIANPNPIQAAAAYATLRVIYGSPRVSAQIANVLDYGAFWVVQVIWGEGLIQGVSDVWFNEEAMPVEVTYTHYLGAPTQTANATLVAAFAAKGITYADTLNGVAYSVFQIPTTSSNSGMPSISARIAGRLVYDPRTTLTVYSDCPALCLADFATNAVYGMGMTVDYPSVTAVANLNDELVSGVKRRTLNLAIADQQRAMDWLDVLATYAGCWTPTEGLNLTLIPDRPTATSKTYSHASGQILRLSNLKKRGVAGMPTALELIHTDTSRIPWRDASQWAYLPGVEAGTAPRRESQVRLPGILTAAQARREAVERLNKLNLADLSCTLEVFDEGLASVAGDVVSVTHPIGLTSKLFRIQHIESDTGRHSLNLLEYDPAVYSDTVVTEPTAADTLLPDPYTPPATVVGLNVVEELYVTGDGAVSSRLRVTWDAAVDLWELNYRLVFTRMTSAGGANPVEVATGSSVEPSYVHAPLEDGYWYRTDVYTTRPRANKESLAAASFTLQAFGKTLPPASVASLTVTSTNTGVVLSWPAVTDLDLKEYVIKSPDWSGNVVERVTATSTNLGFRPLGVSTFVIKALDWSGNESNAVASGSVTLTAPTMPTFLDSDCLVGGVLLEQYRLTWSVPAPSSTQLPIDYFIVGYDAFTLDNSYSTSYIAVANWLGNRTFWVKAVDISGNVSATAYKILTITAPSAVVSTSQVVDNNVLLYWQNAISTLPVKTYELRKGSTWAGAQLIGQKSGGFTTILETVGGTYVYWIAAVDTANNVGTPSYMSVAVAQPPDYVLNAYYISTFPGTFTNTAIDVDGSRVMGVNLTETWQTHFDTRGWASPQAQVTAGYPQLMQPELLPATYEETFDYGTILAGTKSTLLLTGATVSGSPIVTTDISTSPDNSTWTLYAGMSSAYGSAFRYVKVKVTVTGGQYDLAALTLTLDSKVKGDAGTATLTLGGAQAQGNIAVDYTTWIAGMTMPPAGVSLNGSAAENRIVNLAGPSGVVEPVWACVDTDAVSDDDGGWNESVAHYIDYTSGHLFAVFVRASTNNGTTYFGCNDVELLGGGLASNAYFCVGDLPTLNTWYLFVGYIHERGYGTTDTGISGMYSMAGTKLASGSEYKLQASQDWVTHRCYHYYNTTNSGAEVQWMTRPVIIPCTAANAPAMITYLLKCGTGYGASVKFPTPFVDIAAINLTPKGDSPTISMTDFTDSPNPTRFNIFNYTTAGVATGGEVGWAVRGY